MENVDPSNLKLDLFKVRTISFFFGLTLSNTKSLEYSFKLDGKGIQE